MGRIPSLPLGAGTQCIAEFVLTFVAQHLAQENSIVKKYSQNMVRERYFILGPKSDPRVHPGYPASGEVPTWVLQERKLNYDLHANLPAFH